MTNIKEIEKKYKALRNLIVKYREFPINFKHKVDTNTIIEFKGEVDLTWKNYRTCLEESNLEVEATSSLPHLSSYLESLCSNLEEAREELCIHEKIDKKFKIAHDTFWINAGPYIEYFIDNFFKEDQAFNKESFVNDIYEIQEDEMMDKFERTINPSEKEIREKRKALDKTLESMLNSHDYHGMVREINKFFDE